MKSIAIKFAASCIVFTWGAAIFGTANAHVVLEYQVAPAASSYKASFKVGHGCGNSPTRQVVVEVPAGMRGARPMPKAGWTLDAQQAPLATPYTRHGRTITSDVSRITWTAKTREDMLPTNHYDEFVLVAQTPAQAGPVYWPVRQVCEEGRLDWVEIPQPGQKLSDLKAPAAQLDVLPAAGQGAHNH